jgi:hypothetical protein
MTVRSSHKVLKKTIFAVRASTMKKIILLALTVLALAGLRAQKPVAGVFMPMNVPQYMSSNASSHSVPVVFRARVSNLLPNTQYKYYVRAMRWSDTSSTTASGIGNCLFIDSSGQWRNPGTSLSLNNVGQHDTLTTDIGGSYEGWFAFYRSSNAAFNAGNVVLPYIQLQAIAGGSTVEKYYADEEITCLTMDTAAGSTKASAIFGISAAAPKSIVGLYDNLDGRGRPLSMTFVEGSGFTIASALAVFYNDSVQGKNGRWGTIIPNDLSNGVRRITSFDLKSGNALYSNIDSNGVWGWGGTAISTVNPRNAARAIRLTTEECALVPTDFQFWLRSSTVGENAGSTNLLVRRRYANDYSSSVTLFYVGGTASHGTSGDINFSTPKSITFKPGYTAFDTTRVTINDDNAVEGQEVATISLRDPVRASIGLERTHSLFINDNDQALISFAPARVTVKESAGRAAITIKMDKAIATPASVRVLVKSRGDSTFIPAEFRLGSTNTDTTVNVGKSTGPDSVVFFARILDDTDVDPNDTIVLALRINGSSGATRGDSLLTIVVTDNDRPPVYSFARRTATVTEKDGNMRIRVNVNGRNDLNSDFIFRYNAAISNATAGSDFTMNPLARIITVTPNDPDSVIIQLPIIDDELSEAPERLIFTISTLTNSTIGKPDTLTVTMLSDDLPAYRIRQISRINSNGVNDSINVRCRVFGVVHGVNLRSSGLQFTVIDTSGGIQVVGTGSTFGYNVREGDSVMVQGRVGQINGMTVLQNLDTVRRLSTTGFVRTPANVSSAFSETHESRIVRLRNVKLVDPAAWPTTALAANTTKTLSVTDGTRTWDVTFDAETNVDGTPAPSTYFNISGIGFQDDNSSPFNSGYALVPRYTADVQNLTFPVISFVPNSGASSEVDDSSLLITVNIANPNAQVQFELAIKGGTATPNADFNMANRTVVVPSGRSSYTFKVDLFDDNLSEGNETIQLALRKPNWGTEVGADSVYTLTLIDNEANSVNKLNAGTLRVYPNPASGFVQFEAPEVLNRMSISDLQGRVLYQSKVQGNMGVASLEGLSAGVYLVRAETQDGRYYSARVTVK